MALCKLIRALRRITPLVLEHRLPLLILLECIVGRCASVGYRRYVRRAGDATLMNDVTFSKSSSPPR
jgi:hypothetical protein